VIRVQNLRKRNSNNSKNDRYTNGGGSGSEEVEEMAKDDIFV